MSGKIIALAGPSGVGKNFVKQALKTQFPQLSELTVFTTRAGRSSDGTDRKTDISANDFLKMQKENKIIAAHQPFGSEGDWYGFSKEQIDEFIKNKKQILTEIHVDNVALLKKLYGDKIYLLAITAENEYLEYNLQLRNSEKGIDKTIRLESAAKEIKVIEEMWKKNLIDKIINVNWDNRNELAELAINEVGQEVELPTERENKLKLK
jgi:ribose 1,5-bisphosphokinase